MQPVGLKKQKKGKMSLRYLQPICKLTINYREFQVIQAICMCVQCDIQVRVYVTSPPASCAACSMSAYPFGKFALNTRQQTFCLVTAKISFGR